jgi:hypothetical protein
VLGIQAPLDLVFLIVAVNDQMVIGDFGTGWVISGHHCYHSGNFGACGCCGEQQGDKRKDY